MASLNMAQKYDISEGLLWVYLDMATLFPKLLSTKIHWEPQLNINNNKQLKMPKRWQEKHKHTLVEEGLLRFFFCQQIVTFLNATDRAIQRLSYIYKGAHTPFTYAGYLTLSLYL